MSSGDRKLYENEVVKHVLNLREALVRHDENEKALKLMEDCIPYFIEAHPDIATARQKQEAMCAHLISGTVYESYYANNPHERPFEQQYGIPAEQAVNYMPRVAFVKKRLEGSPKRVLDLACNDGMLEASLAPDGHTFVGVDLNSGCVERANARGIPNASFVCGNLYEVKRNVDGDFDAVIAFEIIEHVPDPWQMLHVMEGMTADGGKLYVSTPNGATERGNIDNWDHVEYKGHVRSYTPEAFKRLLEDFGIITAFQIASDGTMFAEVEV